MALKRFSISRNSAPFRLARRIGRPIKRAVLQQRPRAAILMYHRVVDERYDPWNLCVSPANFDAQMALLAERRAQADLAVFADGAAFDRNGSRIAITFDDGYADNITNALPVLERHDMPATIFVVAGTIGRRREYWWDALTRALLAGAPRSPELLLHLPDGMRRFQLDTAALADAVENTEWRPDAVDPQTPRQRLFLDLWAILVRLAPAAQDEAIDQILAWAGCNDAVPAGSLPATEEEIVALGRHPLVRIGSHTQDHVSLIDLPADEQQRQIEQGHRRLESLLDRRIDRFSYPFGRFDRIARAHVEQMGIALACTSHAAVATPRMDRFALPRLQVTDMDGGQFGHWLRQEHGLLAGRS
jgi:peptidoglycan/xylan/chitin deacetylase (PgdA/CDA1 family)